MSAANEEIETAPKPRISPLDLRNTDLVSRLLAATPPYLYNMSLLPNTYFFSEMLRSLVQAKAESSRSTLHHRRARKRPWTPTSTSQLYQTPMSKPDHTEWSARAPHLHNKSSETPLELTTHKLNTTSDSRSDNIPASVSKLESYSPAEAKPELNLHSHMGLFPGMAQNDNSSVILPPPPPPPAPAPSMWYPPLYPTPYGIDPLHFFIDLRVSGHIYDRKNQKDSDATFTALDPGCSSKEENKIELLSKDLFKPSKHASAFSVPVPSSQRSSQAMNLSGDSPKTIKFDVKSMGFEQDSNTNKVSTNYVLSNINNIYKTVSRNKEEMKREPEITESNEGLTDEEKQKKDKDLRALIGLELVVDYMSHGKAKTPSTESSTTDTESGSRNCSPALEVVAIPEESNTKHLTSDIYT